MRKFYHKMKLLLLPAEKDPCPNTAVEAVLCGVPVCYNHDSGTPEIVGDCGLPFEKIDELLGMLPSFRKNCLSRADLYFDSVAQRYWSLAL